MKVPFVSLRNSFLAAIAFATMSSALLTRASAETVHSQTYYMGIGSSFNIGFFASHYDVTQSGLGSNFDVVLTIIVRDSSNYVYSSSSFCGAV